MWFLIRRDPHTAIIMWNEAKQTRKMGIFVKLRKDYCIVLTPLFCNANKYVSLQDYGLLECDVMFRRIRHTEQCHVQEDASIYFIYLVYFIYLIN
jgi:hypothetical protein